MHRATRPILPVVCAALLLISPAARAQETKTMNATKGTYKPVSLQPSPELRTLVEAAARDVLDKWKARGIKDENLAITLIDLSGASGPYPQANFRGDASIYPASVVKMFYLVAVHQQMEDGELKDTPELSRALKDMIVDSSNDATHYVVDVLTGTTSGVELPPDEMKQWGEKRNRMNRYFAALGYTNINVNQKTYCEDAYGRERVYRGPQGENRNRLTTDATARLLAEIATGRAVTPTRSREMMELMKRDPYKTGGGDPDDQSRGFMGRALYGAVGGTAMPGVRLWSKAGWTSTTRHDAAYMELPNGKRFVLAVFTTNQSNEKDIIPTVARRVLDHFSGSGGTSRE